MNDEQRIEEQRLVELGRWAVHGLLKGELDTAYPWEWNETTERVQDLCTAIARACCDAVLREPKIAAVMALGRAVDDNYEVDDSPCSVQHIAYRAALAAESSAKAPEPRWIAVTPAELQVGWIVKGVTAGPNHTTMIGPDTIVELTETRVRVSHATYLAERVPPRGGHWERLITTKENDNDDQRDGHRAIGHGHGRDAVRAERGAADPPARADRDGDSARVESPRVVSTHDVASAQDSQASDGPRAPATQGAGRTWTGATEAELRADFVRRAIARAIRCDRRGR